MPIPHKQPRPKAPRPKKEPTVATQPIVVSGPEVVPYGHNPSIQHDINHVQGLSGIEESIDALKFALYRLTSDDHCVGVALGQNRYSGPVQITLTDEDGNSVVDRFVTAVERIADSIAKLAGLTRPRLESWHEQNEYEPRYKDIAVDGGAPGPAVAKADIAGS